MAFYFCERWAFCARKKGLAVSAFSPRPRRPLFFGVNAHTTPHPGSYAFPLQQPFISNAPHRLSRIFVLEFHFLSPSPPPRWLISCLFFFSGVSPSPPGLVSLLDLSFRPVTHNLLFSNFLQNTVCLPFPPPPSRYKEQIIHANSPCFWSGLFFR